MSEIDQGLVDQLITHEDTIANLRADLKQLTAEVAGLRRTIEQHEKLGALADAAAEEAIQRLRAALRRYGRHTSVCKSRARLPAPQLCDCGWDDDAALAGGDER